MEASLSYRVRPIIKKKKEEEEEGGGKLVV